MHSQQDQAWQNIVSRTRLDRILSAGPGLAEYPTKKVFIVSLSRFQGIVCFTFHHAIPTAYKCDPILFLFLLDFFKIQLPGWPRII